MGQGRRPTKFLHQPPKPKGPKDPKRVSQMEANRLTTVTLRMQHFVNGISYGPGTVSVTNALAKGLLHTEGHAAVVEDQFRSGKAAIIGPRRVSGHAIKEVPQETFDTEYANASPSQTISGANIQDSNSGNKF